MNDLDLEELLSAFGPEALYLAADAEECEQNLSVYLERSWPAFDPSPFTGNWHIDAVCLPPEAEIATDSGPKTIGEIVGSNWAGKVLSFNHKTRTPEWRPVIAKMKSPSSPLVELTFADGATLLATGNHPIFTEEAGYVRADRIQPGQTVLRVRSLHEKISPQPIPASRRILQHEMLRRGQAQAGGLYLQRMWGPQSGWRRHLSRLLGAFPITRQACSVSSMWGAGIPHSGPMEGISQKIRSVLQQGLSCQVHLWPSQSGIHPRAQSRPIFWRLQEGSEAGIGPRWASLFSLFRNGKDGHAPHRLGQGQQCDVEYRDALPDVPYPSKGRAGGNYTTVGVVVSKVGSGLRIPRAVFNIEVEGNNNYFADGALVHNCEHLEAVSYGQIRTLLINIPPRHTKTASVAVAWPTWTWTRKRDARFPLLGPQVRFLCTSYGAEKAQEDGVTARRLIGSEWWQKRWGKHCQIADDRDNAERYDTVQGGSRISTGLGGALLGRGGDIKIVDDPIKTGDANSEVELKNVVRAYDEMFATRATDPKITAEVIIMQRLSEMDLSGHILAKNNPNLVHLCIPAEYEWDRHCTTGIGWSDPRGSDEHGEPLPDAERATRDGLLIWPGRFGAEELTAFKTQPYVWAGQYQQRPEPRGGGIIKPEWWQQWPPEGEKFDDNGKPTKPLSYPPMEYVVAYLDTALTTKEENDPSGMEVWGVWRSTDTTSFGAQFGYENEGLRTDLAGARGQPEDIAQFAASPRMMLMEAWEGHLAFHDLVQKVIATCRRRRVDRLIIEGKMNGRSVQQEILRLCRGEEFGVSIDLLKRAGDKDARLHSVVHLFTSGLIYAPTRSWSEKVKAQCSAGSRGAHDELADCASGALRFLRNLGLAQTQKEFESETRATLSYREPELPYGDLDL